MREDSGLSSGIILNILPYYCIVKPYFCIRKQIEADMYRNLKKYINDSKVVIPDSVRRIGKYAFSDCTNLTSIEIPNSVTEIGDFAFYGCTALASIVIPDSVRRIGRDAFKGCIGLTSIEIPDNVIEISDFAFCYVFRSPKQPKLFRNNQT